MEACVDQAVLSAALIGPGRLWTRIDCLAETGSTNRDLAAAARAGAPSGTVLIACHQNAGRGRFDRIWTAPPGGSIAISVLFRPDGMGPARWSWLPLIAGVTVASALRRVGGVDTEVKWPNDVLIGGRKVCGILAERVESEHGPAAVLGMGINVSLAADELPVPTATSLRLAGSEASATEVALAVLDELEQAHGRWVAPGDLSGWYSARCGTLGRPVRVEVSVTDSTVGTAVEIDADGRLVVRHATGTTAFAAGDVHHLR